MSLNDTAAFGFLLAMTATSLILYMVLTAQDLLGRRWLTLALVLLITSTVLRTLGNVATDWGAGFLRGDAYRYYGAAYGIEASCNTLAKFFLVGFILEHWLDRRYSISASHVLFSFTGRIPRSIFWLCYVSFFAIFSTTGEALKHANDGTVLSYVAFLLYGACLFIGIWSSLAMFCKRWHDCGYSGWMTAILLVPIIGVIWHFVFVGFLRGTRDVNRFGEELREAAPTPP